MDLASKLESFNKQYKRRPRVLHIGNIANNAYNNAKLLNELGFDCDVLCANYYHIMGCPEWEDACVDGDIGDHFHPDWNNVNLNGFKRPDWFVQGPLHLCIKFLLAKRSDDVQRRNKYWRILGCINRTSTPGLNERVQFGFWAVKGLIERLSRYLLNPGYVLKKLIMRYRLDRYEIVNRINVFMTVRLEILKKPVKVLIRKMHSSILERESSIRLCEKVKSDQKKIFGHNDPDINLLSLLYYLSQLDNWKRLFSRYDLIQGYAIDPVYPYLAGNAYFTFEHGTLREIPFDGTVSGTLTGLAYAHAEHVFVTNTDCIENAKRLAGDRVTVIPHPFDERRMDQVKGWQELRQQLLQKLNVEYLIFFPTRHDWIKGHGFADKANDRMIRAFARLRKQGHNIGLICCKWGHNVEESAQLIEELGCSQYVIWYEPMCVVRYEQMIKACDVVADQFLLGAFGGVTFRGLAAGRPVCTYLNNEEVAVAYGEVPPVVNCQTENEILNVLAELFENPERIAEIGRASADWIRNFHSGLVTAKTQAEQYMVLLDRHEDTPTQGTSSGNN